MCVLHFSPMNSDSFSFCQRSWPSFSIPPEKDAPPPAEESEKKKKSTLFCEKQGEDGGGAIWRQAGTSLRVFSGGETQFSRRVWELKLRRHQPAGPPGGGGGGDVCGDDSCGITQQRAQS